MLTPRILIRAENAVLDGGVGDLHGLSFPSIGLTYNATTAGWISASSYQVYSFGPLAGCTKVEGGLRTNWTDGRIASIDAIVEFECTDYINRIQNFTNAGLPTNTYTQVGKASCN